MNQKTDEFFSKVENKYEVKIGRVKRCPICGAEGTPMQGNGMVMEHRVDTAKGIVYHRWSYGTGRIVQYESSDTNVL